LSIPYERVRVDTQALNQIQKTLQAFGCQAFGTMTDNDRQVVVLVFKWRDQQVQLEASWAGYAHALVTKSGWKEPAALEHAKHAVYSILRDWVKGQTTAIECGVLSFETAFLPHMLLKDGRRVIDAAKAAEVLPAPADEKVARLPRR
jgi:metal-sulfur cluster biosynthetic enzyme